MPARRQCMSRVSRVRGYRPAEPTSKAYRRAPFSGKHVEQRLADGARVRGRLLVGQCQHALRSGRRCQRMTTVDYQYCTFHLLRHWHLMVAPSRIPGAGLGLFAVNETKWRAYGKDNAGRPVPDAHVVVFAKGTRIGNGFGGELLSIDDEEKRYGDQGSVYALCWYPDGKNEAQGIVDAFVARTACSYANDAINLHCRSEWPFRNNAYWDGIDLRAETAIAHGDEILWEYGSGYWESQKKDSI